MISNTQPLPVGNAVKLWLTAPAGSVAMRVLRNATGTFSGYADPNAFLVYEGADQFCLDYQGLANGTVYSYATFSFNGSIWTADGSVVAVTPAAIATSVGPDVLSLVRDRLAVGLAAEVAAGRLTSGAGGIQVLTAPPLFDNAVFPIVSVHLKSDAPDVRSIGEDDLPDFQDLETDLWSTSEGWLSSVQLDIVGWVTSNPDTRIALRKAIKKVLLGNLPVFEAAAMATVTFSQNDVEDFETYNVPMYQTFCSFSCLAPSLVTEGNIAPVSDVTVIGIAA